MRVLQPQVDPRRVIEAGFIHFARGEHDLAHLAVELVAVDVDVTELVVRAQLLELGVALQERAVVPEANVAQRDFTGLQIVLRELLPGLEFEDVDIIFGEAEPFAGEGDVICDIRSFERQLVWFDDVTLKNAGVDAAAGDGGEEPDGADREGGARLGAENEHGDGKREQDHQPELDPDDGQHGVDVGIAGAVDDAAGRVEELVRAEPVAEGPEQEKEDEQHGGVGPQRLGQRAHLEPVLNVGQIVEYVEGGDAKQGQDDQGHEPPLDEVKDREVK